MQKIIVLFLFLSTLAKSQDTIAFVSKERTAVKVTEVGMTDIKYNRWDNLTGPQYIVNKNDIKWIKYANGHVDTFKIATMVVEKNMTTSDYKTYSSLESDKIMIRGKKLIYHGKGLNDNKLFTLISNVSDANLKKDLMKDYDKMLGNKRNQYICGFGGLGLGVASFIVGIAAEANNYSSYSNNSGIYVLSGLAAGVTFGVTGAVLSSINKSIRNKRKVEIAKKYNDFK